MSEAQQDLAHLVEDRRVVVTVGSGGVGKTTSAAALGMYGAFVGKKTLVITIDPAKRLANSLGLDELSGRPKRIDEASLRAVGIGGGGSLYAMMLDLTDAWDDFVRRCAPTAQHATAVLENRLYHSLSRDMPGAQEFIACEALYTLTHERDFDLVVLDTPPTANALDFLDAPNRILSMLQSAAAKMFARSDETTAGRLGLRFLDGAKGAAYAAFSKFTGTQFLEDMGAFLVTFREMYAPISARTKGMQDLLSSDDAAFVLVTSPQRGPAAEAEAYIRLLEGRGHPVRATVINRVTPAPRYQPASPVLEALQAGGVPDDVASALADIYLEAQARHESELTVADGLATRLGSDTAVVKVWRRAQSVQRLGDLFGLLDDLVGLRA